MCAADVRATEMGAANARAAEMPTTTEVCTTAKMASKR